MKIYTKKGDKGDTDLIGKRVKKSNVKMFIVGELDELAVRMADFLSVCKDQTITQDMRKIDAILFKVASITIDINQRLNLSLKEEETLFLEEKINEMEKYLPPLKNFITYEGTLSSIKSSSMKTQVRKIERYLVDDQDADPFTLSFINRLSDYFFTLSRYLNYKENIQETKRTLDY